MAVRNLLHKPKLPDFLEWAKSMGAKIEPGRGYFQRVRIRFAGEPPHIIYDKLTDEHYSLEAKTARLVRKYIKMQHAKLETQHDK